MGRTDAHIILQVKLLKAFPSKYWGTMLTCIGASIQTAVVGVCIDRRKSSWMLGWNLQLITILYSVRTYNTIFRQLIICLVKNTTCKIIWWLVKLESQIRLTLNIISEYYTLVYMYAGSVGISSVVLSNIMGSGNQGSNLSTNV